MSNLLGTPVAAAGIDVAGTINGLAATGSGQTLSGALGSATEGLKLQVTGGLTGPRGSINMSQGYAYKLNKLVDNYVGSAGLIAGKSKGINSSIDSIGKSRDSLNLRLAAIEKRYRAQFNALDAAISSMNSTSTFLTQQLAQLSSLK
ncbi:flagellar filament capping protein FliD [Undibacterium arcticum]|uniref:flagellar filament capping protein FliD n=1 Tax=Undibacterium arcticum TaxID=1762892 RepID=UPI0036193856